jgi:hypothetical protein
LRWIATFICTLIFTWLHSEVKCHPLWPIHAEFSSDKLETNEFKAALRFFFSARLLKHLSETSLKKQMWTYSSLIWWTARATVEFFWNHWEFAQKCTCSCSWKFKCKTNCYSVKVRDFNSASLTIFRMLKQEKGGVTRLQFLRGLGIYAPLSMAVTVTQGRTVFPSACRT